VFTVDLHLDLSMNAMEWNRDLRSSVADINAREAGKSDLPGRGRATVSFPSLRAGGIGLVVATQIARYVAPGSSLPGWHSPEQAWSQTQGQLAWYRAMEEAGELEMIRDRSSLERLLERVPQVDASWTGPIGYVLSLEGADSMVQPDFLERAYAYGLRAVGPGHYGPGRYAHGTNATGQMGEPGVELLRRMDHLNMILDATHLCDDAFWQALDLYHGPVWASHNNCRSIVDHNRQFSDDMIRALIDRDAIIGAAMDAWMIVPGWQKNVSTPEGTGCTLDRLMDHVVHICSIAGNCRHVCIGSDLDGGYGREQCPSDIETIADISVIPGLLRARGFSDEDVRAMMHGNAIRFLRNALPA
jgi:membrane dipeptidase